MSELADKLLDGFESAQSIEQLLQKPLSIWMHSLGARSLVLMSASNGAWKKTLQLGATPPEPPSWSLASEALDSQSLIHNSSWTYLPLQGKQAAGLVICLSPILSGDNSTLGNQEITDSQEGRGSKSLHQRLIEGTRQIELGIQCWTAFHQRSRDVSRLNQILTVAANWHTHHDLDRLLQDIAQAATKLLNCDRASIFLWDKSTKELVGHPALGIEGRPLRIADDKGVAGTVLRELVPRRWDRSDPSDEVDRRVDTKSGYRTDSLLAVPLLDGKGKAMGVFEVINHANGRFEIQDQIDLIELAKHASAALANTQQMQSLIQTRNRLTEDAAQQVQLIGSSPEMQQLQATVARVGETDLAVLILGENGTGKEVVSRQIHYQSKRRFEPFIAVNCAAITETLLESELFGHEKGAFTDAHDTRTGKFELANGGTLFLDEIGDMSLAGQAKLLRVLEEKVVVRVGGSSTIPVNVRVLAATNQNLVELVRLKKFREDLYFRLTVVTINLPSLRQRGNDIVELADFFMQSFCNKIGRSKPRWSELARRRLLSHDWPGNVRELRNIVERIAYLTTEDVISPEALDFVRSPRLSGDATSGTGEIDLSLSLADATAVFQTRYIEEQIKASHHNVTQAAERMGMQRSNLYRKMKQLGMNNLDA